MRSWTRWQDWVVLVAGVVLMVSPAWAALTSAATLTVVLLGLLLAATALWSLAAPGMIASEWIHALLGLLAFVAPWAMGYADQAGAAWTSWLVGAVSVVLSLWAVRMTTQMRRTGLTH